MKSTAFEDSLRNRIDVIWEKTGKRPTTLCLTEQELQFLKDELVVNYSFVNRDPVYHLDGREVKFDECYEGVLIEIA